MTTSEEDRLYKLMLLTEASPYHREMICQYKAEQATERAAKKAKYEYDMKMFTSYSNGSMNEAEKRAYERDMHFGKGWLETMK